MGSPHTGASVSESPSCQGKRPIGSGHVSAVLAARARPTSARGDQRLPLLPVLSPLLPGGGLQRGTVVLVDRVETGGAGGATTLAFALLAAASRVRWCGAVGTADPGVVTLAELGVDLGHLVLVPGPGARWAQVTATLLDGMDVVLVQPPRPVQPAAARRLAARARERRAVLVVLAPARGWPEGADVRLAVPAGRWHGVGDGHGHLRGRRVEVVATGRRAAVRPVRAELWLPGPHGRVEPGDADLPGAGATEDAARARRRTPPRTQEKAQEKRAREDARERARKDAIEAVSAEGGSGAVARGVVPRPARGR